MTDNTYRFERPIRKAKSNKGSLSRSTIFSPIMFCQVSMPLATASAVHLHCTLHPHSIGDHSKRSANSLREVEIRNTSQSHYQGRLRNRR